jgi:hypothetical protein
MLDPVGGPAAEQPPVTACTWGAGDPLACGRRVAR